MGNKITLQQAYALSTGTFISPTVRKKFTTNIVSGTYNTKLEALMKTSPIDLTVIPSNQPGTLLDPSNKSGGFDFPSNADINGITFGSNSSFNFGSSTTANKLGVFTPVIDAGNSKEILIKEDETKLVATISPYFTSWPSNSVNESATFILFPPLTIGRCRVSTHNGIFHVSFALSTTITPTPPAPYDVNSIVTQLLANIVELKEGQEISIYNFVADAGNPGVNFNTTVPFLTKSSNELAETTEAEAWSNTYTYQYGEYASYSGTIYRANSNNVPVGVDPVAGPTHWLDTGESTGTSVSKYNTPTTASQTISGTVYYEVRIPKDHFIPFLLGGNGKYSSTPNPSYQANWYALSTSSPPSVLDDTDPNPPTWDAGMYRIGPAKGRLSNFSGFPFILSKPHATNAQLVTVSTDYGSVIGGVFAVVGKDQREITKGSSFITDYNSDVSLTAQYYHITGQGIINKIKK